MSEQWTPERIARERQKFTSWCDQPGDEGTAEAVLAKTGLAALDEIERLQARYAEEYAIVDRVWKALAIETYEQAGGKEISQIVADTVARDQRREQLLRECLPFVRMEGSRDFEGSLAAKIRAELGDAE